MGAHDEGTHALSGASSSNSRSSVRQEALTGTGSRKRARRGKEHGKGCGERASTWLSASEDQVRGQGAGDQLPAPLEGGEVRREP